MTLSGTRIFEQMQALKKNRSLVAGALLLISWAIRGQEVGHFIDERNGEKYATVTYELKRRKGEKVAMTWMAQNLNFEVEGSYCRNDARENCAQYGRLYTWSAATEACPPGWRLPSDNDWTALVDKYGGLSSAGRHLKSKSELWANGGQGTNKSLFNAMPYGTGTSATGYPQFGLNAIFWSSDEMDTESAWDWILVGGWDKIMRSDGRKATTGNAVRCVKND